MKLKQDKLSNIVPKVKRLYHQRYRKEWEDFPSFAPWLQPSNHGFSAHCRACGVDILARLASIKQHQNTMKHQNGMKCNQVLLNHHAAIKEDVEHLTIPDEHEEPLSPTLKELKTEATPPYKYRKEWEDIANFSPWLQATNIDHMAHCKFCNVNMLARIASIKQHENSAKHQKAVKYNKIYTNNLHQVKEEEDEAVQVEHENSAKHLKAVKYTRSYTNSHNHAKEEDSVLVENQAEPLRVKLKSKGHSNPKQIYEVERVEFNDDNENMSNDDSILDTLLSTDEMIAYSNEEDLVEAEDQQQEEEELEQHQEEELEQHQEIYVQDMEMVSDEGAMSLEKADEDNEMINEFDLFGKSVALQLNQMDLEDALLCQDRLQAVITNFRLRVLKRKRLLKKDQ